MSGREGRSFVGFSVVLARVPVDLGRARSRSVSSQRARAAPIRLSQNKRSQRVGCARRVFIDFVIFWP